MPSLGHALAAACLAAAATFATGAAAQTFPSKPVRVIMPFPPGGPSDVMMRAIAQELSERWKQPVLVDNKPGANTIIGAELASKLPPDGHNLFYATAAALSISPVLYNKIPYDAERDFVPVTQLAASTNFLMVSAQLPVTTLRELVQYARANPGRVDYGSFGVGSTAHLDMVGFERAAGVKLNHIPYKGAAQVVPELIQGRVGAFFTSVGTLLVPAIREGKVRVLAVAEPARSDQFPEVPTFVEQGVSFVSSTWLGLVAPAGTPPEIVARIAADVARVLGDPAFESKHVRAQGLRAVGSTPAQFGEYLKQNRAYWADVVRASGVKLDL
jgi:tripartite-type tricarboxylate transporter receptor subunit TctC